MYDIKMKRLRARYGMLGYGIVWAIWETICREGELGYLSFSKYPLSELALELRLDDTQLTDMLNFMAEVGLIDKVTWDNKHGLMNLKLPERGDDWSRRTKREVEKKAGMTETLRSNSEVTPNGVTNILYYFILKHKEFIGVEYPINWGKDGKIVKDLLKMYEGDQIKMFIDEFFEMAMDEKCWHADKCTVGVFKTSISNLIGSLRKKAK